MNNSLILLLSFLLFSINLESQNKTELSKYDAILNENFDKDGPGIAALVAKDGKVIYANAIGYANLELEVPMHVDHVFRIGSITKQFTAVGILMLEEQGKLDLQDEITKFLPDYPTHGKTITVEHLLTHTSGIKSYTNMEKFHEIASKTMSQEEMIGVFKNEPMEFDPGTTFKYNNSGYFLLGVIIEKVSGLSYADFIKEHIFDKTGMNSSYYGGHSPIIKNRASGYMKEADDYVNSTYISMDWPYAAGSLLSTVPDLLKWNTALHEGKLIKKESLERALMTFKLSNGEPTDYGYGWSITNLYGSKSYEHGGGIHGFLTHGIYLPDEKVYVAVFSNCNCQAPEFAASQLALEAIGKSVNYSSGIELNEETKKEYIGVYQIPGKDKRTINVDEDGQLFSVRGGGKFLINPIAKDRFAVEKSLTIFEFVRNKDGEIIEMISHTRDGEQELAKRTDEKPMVRKELEVESEVLKQYVGNYELAPGFSLNITLENGQIYGQATGQQKFQMFAENSTKFFLKIVQAQVEFFENENGVFDKLILYQNGMEMPGKKK